MNLFITDYDGTLFNNEQELKDNIKMLKKLQNNNFLVIISTGRSYPSIKNQVDIYSIPYDYLSCADGSIIYDNKGNIINLYPINNDIIEPYQNFYKNIKYEEIQFSYPEGYSNILKDDNTKLLGINICMSTSNYTKELVDNFIKMSKEYPTYNFLNYMHPNFSYLCIKPKGISKSSAIKYLIDKHKVLNKNVYVIGDSYNDFEMIGDYHGVCMNTSCEEVLNIAKKSYKTVKDYIIDILKDN